jgi:hypothetical protein
LQGLRPIHKLSKEKHKRMLDFRKVLVALSVAGLGLVGTASAQVPVCTLLAPAQGFEGSVAVEGTTELLPTATITCNGQPVTGGLTITLSANVPITNLTVPHTTNLDVVATDNGGDAAQTVTAASAGTVQITFNSVTGVLSTITVKGIRVNPSSMPILSQVSLTLASTSIGVSAPAANFAFVQKTLSAVTISSPVVQPIPAVVPPITTSNLSACSISPTELYGVAAAMLTNGFPDSLHTAAEITNGGAIMATQGTTLAVTFNNLNPGVNYYVPLTLSPGNGLTTNNLTLTAYTSAAATTAATGATSGPGAGLFLLTVNAGSATAYYQVTGDSISGTETATVPLSASIPSIGNVTSFSTNPVAVSITLVSAGTGYPSYSASQTPYTASQTASMAGNGLLSPCSTTLLFPYVVNMSNINYDTGIAITNASGLTSIGSSTGTCQVNYFGPGAPTTQPSPISVAANSTTTFDVGAQAPGINGFAVATCNFTGAHGLAFISFELGTQSATSNTYLAIVTAEGTGVPPTVAF